MSEPPSSQPMPISCKCGHVWLGHLLTRVDPKVWSAHLKTMSCPKCGKGHRSLSIGGRLPVAPEATANAQAAYSDGERDRRWRQMHDTGMSSICIADKMCGRTTTGAHPHDGADFGRCERLLALFPEWRARMGEVADINAYWAALVPRWGEIAARTDPEAQYTLMRSILDPIEEKDPRIIQFGRGMTMSFGR